MHVLLCSKYKEKALINAEVRKNAIRDLTRIYELIIQITNLLQQAEYDSDPEVEETAKWALKKLNRTHTR